MVEPERKRPLSDSSSPLKESWVISESLCFYLNYIFDKFQHLRPVYHHENMAKYNSPLACQLAEFNRGDLEWNFYRKFLSSIAGKTLLDVGCGFGGRSVYYARKQASVIGLDIKANKFKMANAFAKEHRVRERVEFQVADAAALPFSSNSFDIVMSNNTMQYFRQPLLSLQEIQRVAKPEGLICINFGPPWFAPICPETGTCFPWTHLIFSQATIRRSFTRMGKDEIFKHLGEDIYQNNNQLTIKKFRALLSSAGLKIVHFKLWTRPYAAPFIYLPLLKEFFSAQVISVSRKQV
jgi:ubiquinone/menaquinone biosynthesis C-methylase UbiE